MRRLMNETEWLIYHYTKQTKGKMAASKYAVKVTHYRCDSNSAVRWQLVRSYGIDGYLCKTFLPYHLTDDEWQEFYNEYMIRCRSSAYDCTGDAFTAWMDRFDVPAGTWIYHSIGFDV